MKKFIGYGYTNSQGVAIMTKDATDNNIEGYVGTGAGVMNFRAEMHDDDTIVSMPHSVEDCLAFDRAGYGNAVNQYYLSSSSYLSRTVESDGSGTTFSNSHTSSTFYVFLLPPNVTATSIATSCVFPVQNSVIEVDIESYSGNVSLDLRGDNGQLITRRLDLLSSNSNFHIKLEFKEGTGKYYIDGRDIDSYTSTKDLNNNFGVRLGISSSGTVKVKNFKVRLA